MRLCNFHTVVIWGFLLTEGPFQLKWWLWLLYCSFLVALVFVPPKNGGFGYGAPHLPEKKLLKTEKNQGKQKHTHTQKKNNPLEEILRYNISPQTLFFFVCFCFLASQKQQYFTEVRRSKFSNAVVPTRWKIAPSKSVSLSRTVCILIKY